MIRKYQATDLEVDVFKDNQVGRAFYEKVGFVFVEKKVHEETGFDLLRLLLAHE